MDYRVEIRIGWLPWRCGRQRYSANRDIRHECLRGERFGVWSGVRLLQFNRIGVVGPKQGGAGRALIASDSRGQVAKSGACPGSMLPVASGLPPVYGAAA